MLIVLVLFCEQYGLLNNGMLLLNLKLFLIALTLLAIRFYRISNWVSVESIFYFIHAYMYVPKYINSENLYF